MNRTKQKTTDTTSTDRATRWSDALLLPGHNDLRNSLVAELAAYLDQPVGQVEAQCRSAASNLAQSWQQAAPKDAPAIRDFYRQADGYLFDLTWWHALANDESALVQLDALDCAQQYRATRVLDFGAGIGSLGLLMARHGLHVTLADVNPNLLAYARWRFEQRRLDLQTIDLSAGEALPAQAFDLISAVDVFEHLPDPRATLLALSKALCPGGVLFVHLPPSEDASHPMHLWHQPGVLLKHLGAAGMWLEHSNGQRLVLRQGNEPRYSLNRGLDLLPDKQGGIVLSSRPLVALRMNQQAFGMLRVLNGGSTAAEVAAQAKLPLASVSKFLNDMTGKRLLLKHMPAPAVLPSVSVIVPAHGRPAATRACVESLLRLDYPADRLEVIIVDDASHPPLAEALVGLPVRLIRLDTNIGQSAARNLAAREAGGKLLAFIDNDCEAIPDWLKALVGPFNEPGVAIVGGRILSPPPNGPVAAFEAARSPLDMGSSSCNVGPGEVVSYMPACNLLVRRDLMLQIDGFRQEMKLGEDVDLIWRAHAAGGQARYVASGTVVHHHRVRLGELLRRRADYGSSEADLQLRHPASRRVMMLPLTIITLLVAISLMLVWPLAGLLLLASVWSALGIEVARKAQRMHSLGIRLPIMRVAGAVLMEHHASLYHLGANLTRYYSLPMLGLGLLWPPLLVAQAILMITTPTVDYLRHRPALAWPLFVGLYWLELAAYQIGVWRGCIQRRSFGPLLPHLKLGR